MGVRVPAGHAEAVFHLRLSGDAEDMLTTIGVRMDAGQAVTLGLATAMADLYGASLLGVSGAGYSLVEVELKEGPDGNGPQGTWAGLKTSANASQPVPSNTAVLLSKITGFGGRRNRGRMYIPGPAEILSDGRGQLSDADVTAMQSEATGFYNGLVAMGGVDVPVIFHSTPDKLGVPQPAIAPTPITAIAVEKLLATQRRRMRP
jgi:hypothetical protein